MRTAAVNCTPLRPHFSFGRRENSIEAQSYAALTELTDSANEKLVKSGDIKSPAAIAGSFAALWIAAYAGGRKLVSFIDASCFKNGIGVNAEKGLKYLSSAMRQTAKKLNPENAGADVSQLSKMAGSAISSIENGARGIYSKFYKGLPALSENYTASNRAADAFSRAAGTGTAVLAVGGVCTQDSNGDGIMDIMQKSQNAYTKAKTNFGDAIEAAGILSKITENLT